MTYDECMALVAWMNNRFRKAGMKPWYSWVTAQPITWNKLLNWQERLSQPEKIP